MAVTRRQFIRMGAARPAAPRWPPGSPPAGGGSTATRCRTRAPTATGSSPPTALCFWGCGMLAHVKAGRVTKLTGNPAHPLSRGMLCPRGASAARPALRPRPAAAPMVRTPGAATTCSRRSPGTPPSPRWRRSWLAVRQRHGPEALALFTHGSGGTWFKHFMKAWGSPNVGAPSYAQCRGPRRGHLQLTYGTPLGSPEPIDLANARCITLIGSHLGENVRNTQVQELAEAIGRGADLVVVDPRFSVAASKARHWLPVKPGTDIALLLAWMNVIIGEGRHDAAFVAERTTGFAELAAHVADKTPEWAAAITEVPAGLIRWSARTIASARPASLIHPGRHTVWYGDDTQRERAMAILAALMGGLGAPRRLPRPGALPAGRLPAGLPAGPAPAQGRQAEGGRLPAGQRGALQRPVRRHPARPGALRPQGLAGLRLQPGAGHARPPPAHRGHAAPRAAGGRRRAAGGGCRVGRRGPARGHLPGARRRRLERPVAAPLHRRPPGGGAATRRLEAGLVDRQGPGRQGRARRPLPLDGRPRLRAAAAGGRGRRAGRSCPAPACCSARWCRPARRTAPSGRSRPRAARSSSTRRSWRSSASSRCPSTTQEPGPEGHFRLLTGRSPLHTFGRTVNNRLLAQPYPENEVWLNADAASGCPASRAGPWPRASG